MRKDFSYIQKATSVVVATTAKGSAWVEAQVEADNTVDPTVDLLVALEEEYFIIPSVEAIPLKKVFNRVRRTYKTAWGDFPMATYTQFVQALQNGLIGFKLVIWD